MSEVEQTSTVINGPPAGTDVSPLTDVPLALPIGEFKETLFEEIGKYTQELLQKLLDAGIVPADQQKPPSEDDTRTEQERFVQVVCNHGVKGVRALLAALTDLQLNRAVETVENWIKAIEEPQEEQQTKMETRLTNNEKDSQPQRTSEQKPINQGRPYKTVIEDSAGTFVDCLKLSPELLLILEKNSVLSSEMVNNIKCRPNRPDKVKGLINYLKGLGPKSLTAFIDALRATNQHFLANILAANTYY